MTIPRVLLALAILVLGMMMWGLHKDIHNASTDLVQQNESLKQHVSEVGDKLIVAAAKPPEVRTRIKTRYKYLKRAPVKAVIHKPRHPPVRYTATTDTHHLDGLFMFMPPAEELVPEGHIMPPKPPTYSTPTQP